MCKTNPKEEYRKSLIINFAFLLICAKNFYLRTKQKNSFSQSSSHFFVSSYIINSILQSFLFNVSETFNLELVSFVKINLKLSNECNFSKTLSMHLHCCQRIYKCQTSALNLFSSFTFD